MVLFEGLEIVTDDVLPDLSLLLCEGSAHCINVHVQHGSVVHAHQGGSGLGRKLQEGRGVGQLLIPSRQNYAQFSVTLREEPV